MAKHVCVKQRSYSRILYIKAADIVTMMFTVFTFRWSWSDTDEDKWLCSLWVVFWEGPQVICKKRTNVALRISHNELWLQDNGCKHYTDKGRMHGKEVRRKSLHRGALLDSSKIRFICPGYALCNLLYIFRVSWLHVMRQGTCYSCNMQLQYVRKETLQVTL